MIRRSVVAGMAALFVFSIVSWGFAQPAQTPGQGKPEMQRPMMKMSDEEIAKKDEERINAKVEELTQKLNLTPQQQAKVKEILNKTIAEIRTLMKEVREKTMAMMERDRQAIKALLTPEQKPKLDEMSQQGPGSQAPVPPQPPAKGNK